jgi:hypothetical protein
MNRVRACLFAAAASTLLAGVAYAADETRSVPAFESVAFAGSGTVDIAVGKAQSLVLSGDAELLRHITTTVENGELKIGREKDFHWNGDSPAIHITLPKLAALSSAGSAKTTVTGLKGGDMAFRLSGSGDITASGDVDKLSVKLSGSGKAHLEKLSAEAATVAISGSGDAVVQPKRTLVASVSGSGDLRYIGTPQVTSQVRGSGSIRQQ